MVHLLLLALVKKACDETSQLVGNFNFLRCFVAMTDEALWLTPDE